LLLAKLTTTATLHLIYWARTKRFAFATSSFRWNAGLWTNF